jgi:hypothetical protein
MRTLTQEEYKKLYGEVGLAKFKMAEKMQKPEGYFSRVGSQIKGNIQEATQSQTASQEGRMNPLYAGANIAKNVSGAILSPVSQLPVVKQIGEGFSKAGQAIVDTSAGQKATDWLSKKVSPEILGAASDVAETGLNAAGIYGTAKGIQGGVNKIKSTVKNTVQDIKNPPDGGGSGGMVNKVQDYLANKQIDPRTQTILKEVAPEKLDRYVKSGKESMVDPRKLTSIEEAAQTAQRVNAIIKEDMGKIGAQKSASLSSVGGAKVPGIATKQLEAIKPLLQKKLTVSERRLVKDYVKELKALGEKPTAQSVDSTIDKLQATLFERKGGTAIPVSPRVQAFINQSIRALNDDLKGVVDKTLGGNEYSALNSAYAKKAQIFRVLNKALGEGGTRGGSLFNRFFSTADSSVKKLFEIIKQEYGVDLAQDATIARFVMETLGDTRIKPYLNLPPTSARGIVEKVAEYAQETLTSPDKIFETARKKTVPLTSLGESLKNQ